MPLPRKIDSFETLYRRYDVFLFDMWGTIYDRISGLYPDAGNLLLRLKKSGKRVVLTSNAGRPASQEIATQLGTSLTNAHFDGIVTAGEVLRNLLAKEKAKYRNRTYMTIGHERNFFLLEDLGFRQVADLRDADFLIVAGLAFGDDAAEPTDPSFAHTHALLQRALVAGHPLYVAKCDWITYFTDGSAWLGPGPLLEWYRGQGGDVIIGGKPSPLFYDYAARSRALIRDRTLAIGDQLSTDIAGGAGSGFDTLYVRHSFARQRDSFAMIRRVADYLGINPHRLHIRPRYVTDRLRW